MMNPHPLILSLDISGRPVAWLNWQHAACLYVREQVVWTIGDAIYTLHGGINQQTKQRSSLEIHSIISVRGSRSKYLYDLVPNLNNRELFQRDNNTCLYCGQAFPNSQLTRDHIIPTSQGGKDNWENVVSACRHCNQKKGGRTPEQANMPLLAVPFVPNHAEYLILANRHILADQMAFLQAHVPKRLQ